MKRLASPNDRWQFRLEPEEAAKLRFLVENFPITQPTPAQMSRTDSAGDVREREQLLQESLAEHRAELRRQARLLVDAAHLREMKTCWRLTLEPAEREILLQILNDIRVGGWLALGQPEDLYALDAAHPPKHYALVALIHVAGYFEHHLIDSAGEF